MSHTAPDPCKESRAVTRGGRSPPEVLSVTGWGAANLRYTHGLGGSHSVCRLTFPPEPDKG